jgi:hypothetical protein
MSPELAFTVEIIEYRLILSEEGKEMNNPKSCSRCQGRMFLEYDYTDQRYDFVCISCGHVELTTELKFKPERGASALKGTEDRKIGSLSRV